MRTPFRPLFTVFMLTLALASGCKLRETESRSSSDNGDDTPVGDPDDSGFTVGVCKKYTGSETSGTCTAGNYLIHKRSNDTTALGNNPVTDRSLECKVTTADYSSGAMINCLVEADELELAFNGIAFNFNVPSNMCEYVRVMPFHFWNYQPALPGAARAGPTVVSYTITDGTITGSITTSTPMLAGGTSASTGAVPNKAATAARCLYDYSEFGGPNCCVGQYQLTVTTVDSAGGTPVVNTTYPEWGGAVGNCLAGPAMRTQGKLDPVNIPIHSVEYVAGVGINRALVAFGRDADDNGAIMDTAFTANHVGGSADLSDVSTLPAGFGTFLLYQPAPYYEFACLDRDAEVKARIQVFVREWNEAAEFVKYRAGEDTADPDTDGIETNPSLPYEPKNDYGDWDDLFSIFPEDRDFAAASASGGGALMSKMVPAVF